MKLRPYQKKTIDLIKEKMRQGFKRILVVLPTGAGKSVIMLGIAKLCVDRESKVLALAHRRGLVYQLRKHFKKCGADVGTIMSGIDSDLKNNVQVATCQTYSRRINIEVSDWEGNITAPWKHPADTVWIDEAHRSLSKTFQDILKSYDNKIILGFTATPTLSTGVGMGNYYETIVQPTSVRELINCGHLVSGEYYGLPAPDLTGVKIVNQDYEQGELGNRFNKQKLIGDIVQNWNEIANGKKTMYFAVNVKHSQAIVYEFNKFGIPAEHLDAHSDDDQREKTISRLKTGETQVVSNVGLYTEGTDIPELECIGLAFSTKNIGKYLQVVGRGARPFPEKDRFLVLDHGKNINEHGFYEDPIVWGLDGKKINYKKPVPKEPREKHKMNCDRCRTIFIGDTCPRCGTKIENYGKKIETLEINLKKLTQSAKEKSKVAMFKRLQPAVLLGMLKFEANRLGKKDSWIRAMYKNICDRWPKNLDVRPLPATEELKSYLKYLRIKWIKSKKREAA